MEDSEYQEEARKLQEFLIECGAMELYGMTKEGEITYKVNMEIMQEMLPDLYDQIVQDIDDNLIELYKMGIIEISYDENLEASFKMTKEAADFLRERGYNVPESE